MKAYTGVGSRSTPEEVMKVMSALASKLEADGWAIDKDLLDGSNMVYAPDTCVFIPRGLNSIIARVGSPKITKTRKGCSLYTFVACGYKVFKGDTEQECVEQLILVRKLQLEKMLWLMEDYVSKIPNSPKIDPRAIQKIKEMID